MARKLTGDEDFAGLKSAEKTLPAVAYYDPAIDARELSTIWYRQWVYLCRADALPHKQGVLMPEEHYVALFYRWYRQAMGQE